MDTVVEQMGVIGGFIFFVCVVFCVFLFTSIGISSTIKMHKKRKMTKQLETMYKDEYRENQ